MGHYLFPFNTQLKKRASQVAQLVKNLPAMQETWVRSVGWKEPLEKGKAWYSGLENSMDCIVHEVAKSQTQLRDFDFQDSERLSHMSKAAQPAREKARIKPAPESIFSPPR